MVEKRYIKEKRKRSNDPPKIEKSKVRPTIPLLHPRSKVRVDSTPPKQEKTRRKRSNDPVVIARSQDLPTITLRPIGTARVSSLACTHPGKMGDALYALPSIRELCRRYEIQADFYTSSYCEPLRRLFEAQSCIRNFIIPADYVLYDFACGGRPWQMPVPDRYDAVYQMGFPYAPDRALPDFIAALAQLPAGLPIQYEHNLPRPDLKEPYIVTAPRGLLEYRPLFTELAERCPLQVVEIGSHGEGTGSPKVIDKTDLGMLEVLPWLEASKGFVGFHSSMLVLANGFPIPKVVPGDTHHVVHGPHNHYLADITVDKILERLGLR